MKSSSSQLPSSASNLQFSVYVCAVLQFCAIFVVFLNINYV